MKKDLVNACFADLQIAYIIAFPETSFGRCCYSRGGQPVAHAPYVAHWLLKSGALHLFDDKPLLLTDFICPSLIFFSGKQNI